MNDLILDKQKGIKQLQNDIKLNELDYEAKKKKKKKNGKNDNFSKISLPIIFFKKYTHRSSINRRC